jgi:hypothetical protein
MGNYGIITYVAPTCQKKKDILMELATFYGGFFIAYFRILI